MSAAIREAIRWQSDGNQRPLDRNHLSEQRTRIESDERRNQRGNQTSLDRNHLSEQRARIESDERRKYVGLAVPDEERHQRAFGEVIRSHPEGSTR